MKILLICLLLSNSPGKSRIPIFNIFPSLSVSLGMSVGHRLLCEVQLAEGDEHRAQTPPPWSSLWLPCMTTMTLTLRDKDKERAVAC